MFAVLGPIVFEVLDSWEMFESTRKYSYAKHEVMQDVPRLQWLSPDLEEISIEIGLQSAWTVPQLALDNLVLLAEAATANPLAMGNGTLRGWFVITEISEVHKQLAADGTPIAIQVKLKLREWVRGVEIDPFGPPIPDFVPLGLSPLPEALAGAIQLALPPPAGNPGGIDFTTVDPSTIVRAA